MKKIYSLLLLTTIFCAATLATETPITDKKPIIITDFDDVWIKKSSFLGALAYLEPLESLFKAKQPQKNITTEPTEKKSSKLNGFTLRFLDYGRRYPMLASSIPGLIEYIGKSRCLNQPIHNLYKHLKEEGYPLIIATNKDHMLYDLAIETLGNEIPNMVDKVFVAEPESNKEALAQLQTFANKPTTSKNYTTMAQKAINIKETGNIFHVPSKKPALEYFTYVINEIGADNDFFFFDDNQENVNRFNTLQQNSPYRRTGILYNEKNLEQFTEDLKKANLLSETHDKKLLDDIRYPGITGKIKLMFKSFFEPDKSKTSTAKQ